MTDAAERARVIAEKREFDLHFPPKSHWARELADEIAAALREAENEAYEKAIRAVEVMGSGWMNDDQESGWRAAEEAAIAAIRALKTEGT